MLRDAVGFLLVGVSRFIDGKFALEKNSVSAAPCALRPQHAHHGLIANRPLQVEKRMLMLERRGSRVPGKESP
jgi:hypothetical protein